MSINKFETSSAMCQYFKNNPDLSVEEMDKIVCQCLGSLVLMTWREIKRQTVNDIAEYFNDNICGLEEALEANE